MPQVFNLEGSATVNTSQAERRLAAFANKWESKTLNFNLNERTFTRPLGRITGAVGEFDKSLAAANSRVVAFAFSAGALFAVERAFTNLVKSTISVEKQLADINVVLNASADNLNKFASQLFNIARSTGKTFGEVATAATELSRQGLGAEQTLQRTRDAMILTRLAGIDAASSVEVLTAAINSFTKAGLDSITVINKFAAVDAAFAVSTTDLAEAIKRVASSAEDAGVNLDELLGLVTAVQQTTARGGAVIGNAFKTIFTRLANPESIKQLRELGVAIDESQTGIQKLQSLSDALKTAGASQAALIKQTAGGVYQINIVTAALKDLGNQYSVTGQATKLAANATNEAIVRNEELNKTLDTLVNKTFVNFTQAASKLGNISISPVLRFALEQINSTLESFNAEKSEDLGGKIGRGIFNGIGEFLSGPAAIGLGLILTKLFAQFFIYSGRVIKDIANLNIGAGQQKQLQAQIQGILQQNPQILQQIAQGSTGVLSIQQKILTTLREEAAELQRINIFTKAASQAAYTSGIRVSPQTGNISVKSNKKSSGYVPSFASPKEIAAEKIGAFEAGYMPGQVKKANIPGLGNIIYNTREKIVDFGLGEPAIIPPEQSRAGRKYRDDFKGRHKFDPYKNQGYIPNFADLDTYLENLRKSIGIDYKSNYAAELGRTGAIQPLGAGSSRTVYGLNNKLALKVLGSGGGFERIPKGLTRKRGVAQNRIESHPAFNDYRDIVPDIYETGTDFGHLIVERALPFDNTLFRRAVPGIEPYDLLNVLENETPSPRDSPFIQRLRQLFADKRLDLAADLHLSNIGFGKRKGTLSPLLIDPGLDRTSLRKYYLQEGTRNQYLQKRNGGYIPNFNRQKGYASDIKNAISRETTAGIPLSKIRVDTDPRLKSSGNAFGLGVYNTIDEPGGLREGVNRALKENTNPKKYGIPNFAKPLEIDPLLVPEKIRNINLAIAEKEFADLQNAVRQNAISFSESSKSAEKIAQRTGLSADSLQRMKSSLGKLAEKYTLASRENIPPKLIEKENAARRRAQLTFRQYTPQEIDILRSRKPTSITAPKQLTAPILPKQLGAGLLPLSDIKFTELVRRTAPDFSPIIKQLDNLQRTLQPIVNFGRPTGGLSLGEGKRPLLIPETTGGPIINTAPSRGPFFSVLGNPPTPLRPITPTALGGPLSQDLNVELRNKLEEFELRKLSETADRQARIRERVSANTTRRILEEEERARVARLPIKASRIFGGGDARAELAERDPGLFANIKQQRAGRIQAGGFALSFFAPVIASTLTEFIDQETKGGRLKAKGIQGVSDTLSFAGIGATLGAGPYGIAAGAILGGGIGIFRFLKELNDDLPEFAKTLDRVSDSVAKTNDGLRGFLQANEQLKNIFSGNVAKPTIAQLERLQSTQRTAFSQIDNKDRALLINALRDPDPQILSDALAKIQQRGQNAEQIASFNKNLIAFTQSKSKGPERERDIDNITNAFLGLVNKNGQNIRDLLFEDERFREKFTTNLKGFAESSIIVQPGTEFGGTIDVEVITKIQKIINTLADAKFDLKSIVALDEALGKAQKNPQALIELVQSLIQASGKVPELKNLYDQLSDAQKKNAETIRNLNDEIRDFGRSLEKEILKLNLDFASREIIFEGTKQLREAREEGALKIREPFVDAGEQIRSEAIVKRRLLRENQEREQEKLLSQRPISDLAAIADFNKAITSFLEQSPARERLLDIGAAIKNNIGDTAEINEIVEQFKTDARSGLTGLDSPEAKGLLEKLINTLQDNETVQRAKLQDILTATEYQTRVIQENENTSQILEQINKNIRFGGGINNLTRNNIGRKLFNINELSGLSLSESGRLTNKLDLADVIDSLNRAIPQELREELESGISLNIQKALPGIKEEDAALIARQQVGARFKQPSATRLELPISQLPKPTEREIISDIVTERSDELKKDLRDVVLSLKAMGVSGNYFSDEMAAAVQEVNELNIRLGNFQNVNFAESFFGQLRYSSKDFVKDLNDGLVQAGQDLKSSFSSAFKEFTHGTKSAGDALKSFAIDFSSRILDKSIDIATNQLFSGLGAGISAAFGIGRGYSSGGVVRGGSGGTDDIPAYLSQGEFVITKDAVKNIGVQNLNAINEGKIRPADVDSIIANSSGVNVNLRNRYRYDNDSRPTTGRFDTSSSLSDIALTDENNPQNQIKFAREQGLLSYLQARAEYDENVASALRDYKTQTRRAFTGQLISAAVSIGGAYAGSKLQGLGNTRNVGGGYSINKSSAGYVKSGVGGYQSFGNIYDTEFRSAYNRAMGGPIRKYARGGRVFGAESSADNIPAMLSAGEFVVKKSAVQKYGNEFFERLNGRGYADGGLVGENAPVRPGVGGIDLSDSLNKLVAINENIRNILQQNNINNANNRAISTSPGGSTKSESSPIVVNFTNNVTVQKDGNVNTSSESNTQGQKENRSGEDDLRNIQKLNELIKNNVYQVIFKESQDGGILKR